MPILFEPPFSYDGNLADVNETNFQSSVKELVYALLNELASIDGSYIDRNGAVHHDPANPVDQIEAIINCKKLVHLWDLGLTRLIENHYMPLVAEAKSKNDVDLYNQVLNMLPDMEYRTFLMRDLLSNNSRALQPQNKS